MRRPLKTTRVVPALLFALVSVLVSAPNAHAAWGVDVKGRVIHVADGDTIDIDIYGDGTSTPVRTRIAGIQAMEIHVPQTTSDDECHAKQAQDYLKSILRPKDLYGTGEVVLIRALHASSSSLGRPLRHIIRERDGLVVGRAVIAAQYAFAFPVTIEPTYNRLYMTTTQAAINAPKSGRIWDTGSCGWGPAQGARLKMWANYDSEPTMEGEKGEWIKIQNLSGSGATLKGWHLRDSGHTFYSMPTRTIAAGGILTIYIVDDDSHTNTTTKLFWNPPNLTHLFEDPDAGKTIGDEALLVDPHGDVRAVFAYPCLSGCVDPLAGKIELTANYDADGGADTAKGEWINLRNISGAELTITRDYLLETGTTTATTKFLAMGPSTIPAGHELRVYMGTGTATSTTKYWGLTEHRLYNSGGWVRLRRWNGQINSTFTWPCSGCPSAPAGISIQSYTYAGGVSSEVITISNNGASAIDLHDWAIQTGQSALYDFGRSAPLDAGKTLTLRASTGTDAATDGNLVRYWDRTSEVLRDSGGCIRLLTQFRRVVQTASWKNGC
jgi:hypothetical protein